MDNGRFSDGKIKFDESLDKVLENTIIKPIVMFTPIAWLKMKQLVNDADGEIGWHGIVDHQPNSAIYLVKDLLVYPQTVSGATVTTDDKEYGEWLMHFDDPVFNKIRFQAHSHVNFNVFASGVDQQFYDSILQTLQENDYYIFMIINKRGDINIILYDFTQNIIFDEKDTTIKLAYKNSDIKSWAAEQMKAKVKHYTYTPTPPATTPARFIAPVTTPNADIKTPPDEESYEDICRRYNIDPEIEYIEGSDTFGTFWVDGYGVKHYYDPTGKKDKKKPGRPTKAEQEAKKNQKSETEPKFYINPKTGGRVYY